MLGLIAEVLDAPMVDRAVDKRWLGSGAGGRSTWTAVPEVERRKLSEPAGIESFDDANLKRERRACGRRKAAPGREQPPKPGYCERGELAIGNLISGAATKTSDWRGPNGIRTRVMVAPRFRQRIRGFSDEGRLEKPAVTKTCCRTGPF